MAPTGSKGADGREAPDGAAEPDRVLVERAQRGDRDAFSRLIERYQDRLVNFCYRRCRRYEDALDVAQDVFIKAYKAIGSYQGQSAFYTWLYRIAVNTSVTHWQKRKRHDRVLSLEGQLGGDEDGEGGRYEPGDEKGLAPEDEAIRDEGVRLVRAAIAELDETDGTLITLRDIEGLSYDEIAEVLDMKLGSVKSHLHRARGRLKEKLQHVLQQ